MKKESSNSSAGNTPPSSNTYQTQLSIQNAYDNVGAAHYIASGYTTTDDVRPTFSGRGPAKEVVILYSGDTILGSTTIDNFGRWEVEIKENLGNGTNSVFARTASQQSNVFDVIVRAEADVPVRIISVIDDVGRLETIRNGGKTDDTRPEFYGSAGKGEIVTLYSGTTVLGSAQTDESGYWSLEIDSDLTSGNYAITARTTTQESSAFNIIVESNADVPVEIYYAYDNVGQNNWIYNNTGIKTDDTRPTFYGSAGKGQIVTLYSGEQVLGSVVVNDSGNWNFEITNELASGNHSITASTATQQSGSFNISVETGADVPVWIDYAFDNVLQQQYLYNNSGVKTDDARPTFYGSAGIGQIVTLYSGEMILGSVRADNSGRWGLEISQDLPGGSHAITARTATQESKSFSVIVETAADVPVKIDYAYDNVGQQQYIYNNTGIKTDDARPTFFGSAGRNQIVTLYSGETVLGSVQANAYGSWSLEITQDLPGGNHAITARTATQESKSFSVIVETAADVPVKIDVAFDSVGAQQWLFNNSGVRTDDARPTFHGTAGRGQIVTLYSGETVLGSVQAGTDGKWVLEITEDLTDGRHEVIARTANRESDSFNVHVETAVPVTINIAYDNVGDPQWLFNKTGEKTDDTRPTFYGTAGKNQIVTLYSGTEVLGSVQANTNGDWNLEITKELVNGVNTVIARTENGESGAFTVNVETVANVPVTIDAAHDNVGASQWLFNRKGEKTDDTRPTFYGTAGKNQIVTLYSGTEVLGSVQANAKGDWYLEIDKDLVIGINNVIARTETNTSDAFVVNAFTPVKISLGYDNFNESQTLYNGQGKTDDVRPSFSGRSGSEEIVGLYAGNKFLGSVQADIDGNWSMEIIVDLPNGSHSITAVTKHSLSAPFVVNVETVAEKPVIIVSAWDNVGVTQVLESNSTSKTDDTRPTFSGTAGSRQIVTLYSGEIVLGSVQAGNDGNWSLEISLELTSGRNEVIARTATQESAGFIVNVGTEDHVPVTIVQVYDNVGHHQYLANGVGKTDDTRPTFKGRAGKDQIVTLYSGQEILGSVQADSKGVWTLEIAQELVSGVNNVTARTDTHVSDAFVINVELAADVPVVITLGYDNVGESQTLYNGKGQTDDARPSFAGRSGSEQIVSLYAGDKFLGSVRASINGNWSLEIETDLPEGISTIIAKTSTRESEGFVVNVDTKTAENEGTPVLITWAFDNVNNEQILRHDRGTTDDTKPTFYGTAGKYDIVTLYAGQMILGSVQANEQGYWSLEITNELTAGVNEVVAKTATNQSSEFVVNVDTNITPVTLNVLNPDDANSEIGNGDTISFIPNIAGTAAAFAAVDVAYTSERGTFVSRIYADENGNWQTTPDFLHVDKILGSKYHIQASSGDSSTEVFVVDISPSSAMFMMDVLIDNDFALFNEMPLAEFEEQVELTIGEEDMQFQSDGIDNSDSIIRPAIVLSEEEQNYLLAAI